ncbi:MAG: DUF1800 domain-containing protein [Myxococcota bacterium]
MRIFVLLCAIACGSSGSQGSVAPPEPPEPPPEPVETPEAPTDDARAESAHALRRFSFGARPGDIDETATRGARAFLLAELDREATSEAARFATRYPVYDSPAQLRRRFPKENPRTRSMDAMNDRDLMRLVANNGLHRYVDAEHQLREVMVDFWVNHFSVFLRKQRIRYTIVRYIEDALRPHALGRFEDMLVAVAQHPAMLEYLDNASSVRERARGSRGLNENYARELLELHTLGVDGGYTQNDVREAARVLTGWGIGRNDEAFTFVFRAQQHDARPKTILGQRFEPGGVEEGVALLRFLAARPETATFLARKLCQKFVSDAPDDALVERVAARWRETRGDIRAALRIIIESHEFWASRGAMLKTPLEFVTSAVRAVGGEVQDADRLRRSLQRMRMPLYGQVIPTGYPEAASQWASTAGMLARMQFARELVDGGAGVRVDVDALLPADEPKAQLIARLHWNTLGGQTSAATRAVLARTLDDRSADGRTLALALALASPEFQAQ